MRFKLSLVAVAFSALMLANCGNKPQQVETPVNGAPSTAPATSDKSACKDGQCPAPVKK